MIKYDDHEIVEEYMREGLSQLNIKCKPFNYVGYHGSDKGELIEVLLYEHPITKQWVDKRSALDAGLQIVLRPLMDKIIKEWH